MNEMEQMREMMNALYEVMDDQRLAKSIARVYHRIYICLVEEGFDKAEAMQILLTFNIGKK